MSSLDRAVEYILEDEGPEINEAPNEPGGISRYGVSLAALIDDYKARKLSLPNRQTVRDLSKADAAAFYARRAVASRFDELPSGIDYVVFNTAITVGPSGAALICQMSCDMWPTTAKFDEATMAALRAGDPKILVHSICSAWYAWKARSGSDAWLTFGPAAWERFGHGWTNRNRRVRERALKMTGT